MKVKTLEPKRGIVTDRLLDRAGISSSQLHDWVNKGIMPSYIHRKAYPGNGMRFWYPPEALEVAKKIKAWRAEGKPYWQIRIFLKARELAK
jgi:DNA-binding transcriptional MerR regulator